VKQSPCGARDSSKKLAPKGEAEALMDRMQRGARGRRRVVVIGLLLFDQSDT